MAVLTSTVNEYDQDGENVTVAQNVTSDQNVTLAQNGTLAQNISMDSSNNTDSSTPDNELEQLVYFINLNDESSDDSGDVFELFIGHTKTSNIAGTSKTSLNVSGTSEPLVSKSNATERYSEVGNVFQPMF